MTHPSADVPLMRTEFVFFFTQNFIFRRPHVMCTLRDACVLGDYRLNESLQPGFGRLMSCNRKWPGLKGAISFQGCPRFRWWPFPVPNTRTMRSFNISISLITSAMTKTWVTAAWTANNNDTQALKVVTSSYLVVELRDKKFYLAADTQQIVPKINKLARKPKLESENFYFHGSRQLRTKKISNCV